MCIRDSAKGDQEQSAKENHKAKRSGSEGVARLGESGPGAAKGDLEQSARENHKESDQVLKAWPGSPNPKTRQWATAVLNK